MKIKNLYYTDNDLDGFISAFLLNEIFGKGLIVFSSMKGHPDDEIMKYINENDFENIFITDLYPKKEETYKFFNNIKQTNVVLLDHHISGKFLNKYNWANICFERNSKKQCGATLVGEYLINKGYDIRKYSELIELVRIYDVWEENKRLDDAIALNDIFLYMDKKDFYKKIYHFVNGGDLFSKEDIHTLKVIKKMNKNMMDKVLKERQLIYKDNIKIGIIFSNNIIYRCIDELLEQDASLDIGINICLQEKTINLKTNKRYIDISDIAIKNGGGGQITSGAFGIKDKFIQEIIKDIKI